MERAPCDTQLRTILDPVEPAQLRSAYRAVHRHLQRPKALQAYEYLDGHYVVSIDGTGQFASTAIHCPECCAKHSQGQPRYSHQLLGAVVVPPQRKTVLPLAPEAITRPEGAAKNDCERNASKRLLRQLRQDYPQLKRILVEDSLASNGPHLELLHALDLRYLIGVKEGDHAALFEAVQAKLLAGEGEGFESTDEAGVEHGYRFVNDLPLNHCHPDLRVNFLEYWESDGEREARWSWVTDIWLRRANVEKIMRGGRARWKIENETFNTLKNQLSQLEHNYGHGQQHLATVLAMLMMLAFLVDQVQELSCRLFQAAREHFHSRTSLWERLRAWVSDFCGLADAVGGDCAGAGTDGAEAGYLVVNSRGVLAVRLGCLSVGYLSVIDRGISLSSRLRGGVAGAFSSTRLAHLISAHRLRAGIAVL